MKTKLKHLLIVLVILSLFLTANSENLQAKPQQHVEIPKQKQEALKEGKILLNVEEKIPKQNPTANSHTPNSPNPSSQNDHSIPTIGNIEQQNAAKQNEASNSQNNELNQEFAAHLDPLQEDIIRKEQKQMDIQQRLQEEKKLHQWVAQQMEQMSLANNILTHQIFSFVLDQELQFKWNPSQVKQGPLSFVIQVYDYYRGDILFPDNPKEDDYVEVSVQPDHSPTYQQLGKVYLKKMFTINFFTDFTLIKLKNHYDRKMFVQISLEATKFVPQTALDDDDLKIPAQKINSILQSLEQTEKQRQKTFREEWSFKDRQEHHQSEMLILTGVQLFVILGTAIVQIYCIKNLFDNRLIV